MRFEQLLSTVSQMSLRLPSERVEEAFHEALELIIRTLDVDRCVLAKFDEAEGIVRIVGSKEVRHGKSTEVSRCALGSVVGFPEGAREHPRTLFQVIKTTAHSAPPVRVGAAAAEEVGDVIEKRR
jgi:GAF domain-containing protein